MWSCGTSSDIMNGPFETSDLTADGSTAPHLSDPYLSMTSWPLTGCPSLQLFLRRWNVQVRPSDETSHRSAAAGCTSVGLPLESNLAVTSVSNSWRSTAAS